MIKIFSDWYLNYHMTLIWWRETLAFERYRFYISIILFICNHMTRHSDDKFQYCLQILILMMHLMIQLKSIRILLENRCPKHVEHDQRNDHRFCLWYWIYRYDLKIDRRHGCRTINYYGFETEIDLDIVRVK